mgnify:CR=1 FL=1
MSEKENKKTLKDTAVEIIEDKTGIDVTSKKDIKAVKRFAKEHNPLKNDVTLPDGSEFKWKVKPKLNEIEKTKVELEWNKKFIDDDVEITVKINSQPIKLFSQAGDDKFSAKFSATKKF